MRPASRVWFSTTFSCPSQLIRGEPKAPPEKSCTIRTPFSSSRRASRQLRPKSPVCALSSPYISRVAAVSASILVTSGTANCILAAS